MVFDQDELKKISGISFAEQIAKANPVLNTHSTILAMAENMKKAVGFSSFFNNYTKFENLYVKPYNSLEYLINPMRNFQNNNYLFSKSNSIESLVLGGSVTALINAGKLANANRASSMGLFDIAKGIKEAYSTHENLLRIQSPIIEQLARGYFSSNVGATPSWIDKISEVRPFTNPTIYDLLTAGTFAKIDAIPKGDDTPEEIVDKAAALIEENEELKNKVYNLTNTVSLLLTKQSEGEKVTEKELKEPKKILTEIIHEHLLKNTLSKQSIYVMVCFLEFLMNVIIIGIILEGIGKDIFDGIFGEKEENKTIQYNITNSVTNNYTLNNISTDFAIEDAQVFCGHSIKTRYVGKLKKGTPVLIYKTKPKWCLIEATIEKKIKKTGEKKDTIIKAWVMKKYLDSFQ